MDVFFVVVSVFLFVTSVYLVPVEALRVGLALPFVLFLPGYALQAALLPTRGGLDGIERAALSFGLSVALVPLVGLALHLSPWGLHLGPIVVALASVTLGMAGVAYYRRRHSPFKQPARGKGIAGLGPLLRTAGLRDRAFVAVVIIGVIGVWAGLAYAVARPSPGERFTEFYILGPTGNTEGYPSRLGVASPATVRVGIVNRERQVGTYRVEVSLAGDKVGETASLMLQDGEKWEDDVMIVPKRVSDWEKLQITLYRDSGTEPYKQLYLWVFVSPAD